MITLLHRSQEKSIAGTDNQLHRLTVTFVT